MDPIHPIRPSERHPAPVRAVSPVRRRRDDESPRERERDEPPAERRAPEPPERPGALDVRV